MSESVGNKCIDWFFIAGLMLLLVDMKNSITQSMTSFTFVAKERKKEMQADPVQRWKQEHFPL